MKRKHKGITPSFPEFRQMAVPENAPQIAANSALSRDGYLPGLSPAQTGRTAMVVSGERFRSIYEIYMTSDAWRMKRVQVLDRACGRCERCGKECNALEVHHLTYERFGGRELLSDLEALCGECHPRADKERVEAKAIALETAIQEAEETVFERGLDSWMRRAYGENWKLEDDATIEHERQRFEAWRERDRDREEME